jgi:hypothetical protein
VGSLVRFLVAAPYGAQMPRDGSKAESFFASVYAVCNGLQRSCELDRAESVAMALLRAPLVSFVV